MLSVTADLDDRLQRLAAEARAYHDPASDFTSADFATPESLARVHEMLHAGDTNGLVASARVEVLDVPGAADGVTARAVRAPNPGAVYVHFHMGGWVVGSAAGSDHRNVEIADRCSVTVVSVDYRLAPEHPAPAQLEDAEAAARWLLAHGDNEFGATRLILGGESAGATLAVLLAIKLRDAGLDVGGIAALNLLYGVYDFSASPSQRRSASFAISEHVRRHAFPNLDAEALRAPAYSPLYADLRGLPPARFTVGTDDSLLDDTLFMAARWDAAGNQTVLDVYPSCRHGFDAWPLPIADEARSRIDAYIAERAHST
jgi:acetyl esterase/lipase